jgi:hypothetical protein
MKRWILSSSIGLAISVMALHGHHVISAVYDSSRQVTIEGTIAQFQFINPHPYVTVDVKRGDSSQQWRLEMDNRSELADIGMTSDTLKKGDRVIVSGSPARSQSPGLYIRRLDRPSDGFWYEQVGSSPRIRTSR